jgi:pimeloyl-ACP methyl ester carboxylesterase
MLGGSWIIRALGFTQVDLFGFSMGGMIAQEIVLMDRNSYVR